MIKHKFLWVKDHDSHQEMNDATNLLPKRLMDPEYWKTEGIPLASKLTDHFQR